MYKTLNTIIIGIVLILFIWFLIASYFNDYKTECPIDNQMKVFLINFGEDRINTKDSCYAGCVNFIAKTGYNIDCNIYCK